MVMMMMTMPMIFEVVVTMAIMTMMRQCVQ